MRRHWWLMVAVFVPFSVRSQARDTVRIDGSNGVMPLARALAAAFQEVDPSTVVTFGDGLGSRARIDALARGAIQIALASHGLDTAALARQNMTAHRVAVTPVVFAVHPMVTVNGLTSTQICQAFGGTATRWNAFGGSALDVLPVLRPETEVDTEVIREGIGCLRGLAVPPNVAVVETTDDMARAIRSRPGAIGVTTSTVVQQALGAMRAISIDGVAPTVTEVTAGRYRLVRPAFLVTGPRATPAVQRFVSFARSTTGQRVIVSAGALPVP
ncbi:MAG: substrate-binding domain-containing protein [Gemmatimonadaceae bacterium]|nr:substrate-binding domain-containing protein [Gemmatimonadaceae bacterium]